MTRLVEEMEQPTAHQGAPIIERINAARRVRHQAILDDAEARKVPENLDRRAADPKRYRKWCWLCQAVVDEGSNEHCRDCNWLVCWCGACRSPDYTDSLGQRGACRTGAWTLGIAADFPDRDFRGQPILTSAEPTPDAQHLRDISARHGIRSVFHWSPARAIPSVLRYGLLARPELRELGIDYVGHQYGSADKERALGTFVATSLRPKMLMMAEWSTQPVVWELDPEILVTEGALFIPDNTAKASVDLDEALAARGADAYQHLLHESARPGAQPELLIPRRIPRMAIRRVHVQQEQLARELLRGAEEVGWRSGINGDWTVVGPPPPQKGDGPSADISVRGTVTSG